jgi:putative endonuclease
MRQHNYYVYIATNQTHTVLYIGMTNNLRRRISEHRNGAFSGFTRKYKVNKLIYYEHTTDVEAAIRREKQLKGWKREKKRKLIAHVNPNREDLPLGEA